LDKLSDLSWLGEAYADQGWFEVDNALTAQITSSTADLVWDRAKQMLRESDWSMLPDVPMTSGNKAAWIEYRRGLREIRLQAGFPDDITWPMRPE